MTNEDYNGWVNRETWCFNLYLRNDVAMYHRAKDAARAGWYKAAGFSLERDIEMKPDLFVGEAIMEMMTELYEDNLDILHKGQGGALQADILRMFVDIGSLWRVDLAEIGAGWADDVAWTVDA